MAQQHLLAMKVSLEVRRSRRCQARSLVSPPGRLCACVLRVRSSLALIVTGGRPQARVYRGDRAIQPRRPCRRTCGHIRAVEASNQARGPDASLRRPGREGLDLRQRPGASLSHGRSRRVQLQRRAEGREERGLRGRSPGTRAEPRGTRWARGRCLGAQARRPGTRRAPRRRQADLARSLEEGYGGRKTGGAEGRVFLR